MYGVVVPIRFEHAVPRLALVRRSHGAVELRQRGSIPVRDVVVWTSTRLPAHRPTSGDCEQSAGMLPPRAQTSVTIAFGVSGRGKALFAFLEPAPQAVGAEPFLGFD